MVSHSWMIYWTILHNHIMVFYFHCYRNFYPLNLLMMFYFHFAECYGSHEKKEVKCGCAESFSKSFSCEKPCEIWKPILFFTIAPHHSEHIVTTKGMNSDWQIAMPSYEISDDLTRFFHIMTEHKPDRLYSPIYWTLSKQKTCLNQTDFTILSTEPCVNRKSA
jgi:hypothetical protein